MARKSVTALMADRTVALGKDTKYVEGYYLGSRQVPSKKSKTGLQTVHYFKTETETLGVWGFFQLDTKLGSVPRGCETYVKYVNKTTLKNGNTMHNVNVDFDDEIVLDSIPDMPEPQTEEPDYSESAEETESEESEETADVDEETIEASEEEEEDAQPEPKAAALTKKPFIKGKPLAAAASAASKSKVESLLSKSKR